MTDPHFISPLATGQDDDADACWWARPIPRTEADRLCAVVERRIWFAIGIIVFVGLAVLVSRSTGCTAQPVTVQEARR